MRMFHIVLAAVLTGICLGAEQAPLATDWPTDTPDATHSLKSRLGAMETSIRSGAFQKIGSILIARHGKLVYEAYFDGDADTLRDTRSVTKSITDALVGLAISDGSLASTQVHILDMLPGRAARLQNVDSRKSSISVEDLLTMSSPLECDDWNDASRGNEERMYLVEDWTQFVLDLPIRGRSHLGNEVTAPPFGRFFSYCTGGVFVLSEVIENTTGVRADRYAQARLFDPLGIRNVTWLYSPMNTPHTGGKLMMTSRDLLKIVQLYLNGGKWQGRQILDAAWVRTSTQPHARIDEQTEYGYLWWLKSFASRGKLYPAFYMSGNGGNKAVGLPALDIAVVITSTNYNTHGMHEQTERLLNDYILDAIASAD
jgi:CubicO group peptidase (beta-lactamase class C family)